MQGAESATLHPAALLSALHADGELSSSYMSSGQLGRLPYTPRAKMRAQLLLLLARSYPEPLTLDAIRRALEVNPGTHEDKLMQRALRHFVEVGVASRIARGTYIMAKEYYEKTVKIHGFYKAIKQIIEPEHILIKLKEKLNSSKSATRNKQDGTGAFRTNKNFSKLVEKPSSSINTNKSANKSIDEHVVEYARSKYGGEIDKTDELVLRVFSRIKKETGSWYIEYTGYGFDIEVQDWARRLGLCSSSSNSSSGCPSTAEIQESLRKLVRLRLLFYDNKRRKIRLNKKILEKVVA